LKPKPAPAPRNWFKTLRVSILLFILAVVAITTWQDRVRSIRWREPLYVAIYPIAADDSPVTSYYVDNINSERFATIEQFFTREAQRYRLDLDQPVKIRLREQLHSLPPQRSPDAGVLGTVVWSLKLRYWAWRSSGHVKEPEDIRMFVLYHDPALTPTVPHSLGLEKGLIGVVYAFATPIMNGGNNVVIAHEMLHTLGATDKYEPGNDAPRFPDGYGDPQQQPLYPQQTAELMAGRRMVSATQWVQATGLQEVVIGPATAAEIHWPQHAR
jgi:hypothetical protein